MKKLIPLFIILFFALISCDGEIESYPPAPDDFEDDPVVYDFTGSDVIPGGIWGNEDIVNSWGSMYEKNNVKFENGTVEWTREFYTKNYDAYLPDSTVSFTSPYTSDGGISLFDYYVDNGKINYVGFPFTFRINRDTLFIYNVYYLEGGNTEIPGGTWLICEAHDWGSAVPDTSYSEYVFRTGAEEGRNQVDCYRRFTREREPWQDPMIAYDYEIAGDKVYLYTLGTDELRYSFRWYFGEKGLVFIALDNPDAVVTYLQPLD